VRKRLKEEICKEFLRFLLIFLGASASFLGKMFRSLCQFVLQVVLTGKSFAGGLMGRIEETLHWWFSSQTSNFLGHVEDCKCFIFQLDVTEIHLHLKPAKQWCKHGFDCLFTLSVSTQFPYLCCQSCRGQLNFPV
jgi:hypothetical protein